MTGVDWAAVFVMAGVGGVLGAASAVLLAGARASGAYAAFKEAFRSYMAERSDPSSQALAMEFEGVDAALSGLMGAVEKLKRALRRK